MTRDARASAASSAAIRRDSARQADPPITAAFTRPSEWAVKTKGMPSRPSTIDATQAASA